LETPKEIMKITAIVQARSDSKRLKNKMSTYLSNLKILEWVLIRLKKNDKINKFIVATTTKNEKQIIEIAKKYKYSVFKGSENDVLTRFYLCAKKNKAKIIIRVCADNPFIDSNEINSLINYFLKNKLDYAYNNMQTKKNLNADGFGAEIFTFDALEKVNKLAQTKIDREHVTKFIREKKNVFKSACLPAKNGLNFPYLRFDINTNQDLKKIKKLINDFKINLNTSAMNITKFNITKKINDMLHKLFPMNRSLTGLDNKKTLDEIKKIIPLNIKKIQSGKKVYDWKVPQEWHVKEGWIKDHTKNKIVDFKDNNLHLVGYSNKFSGFLTSKELLKKTHYHPTLPNAIPYKTSYYNKDWGFCVNKKIYNKIKLSKKKFEIKIDSKFKKGNLIYGELLIRGKSKKEILISTYICHPSMANDNLSGIILTTYLAKFIKGFKDRYWSYRIIFLPETIGAISYCKINEDKMKNIDFGLVICNVGGKGNYGYKKSYNNNHFLNKTVENVFNELKIKPKIYPFDINGSDERQYSSQFFGINICSIFKDKYYEFKGYHSSDDNLNFVKPYNIFNTLKIYQILIERIESQVIYKSKKTKCEAMLSKYNLYPKIGGDILPGKGKLSKLDITLWIMFLSDGKRTIDQVADYIGIKKSDIMNIYKNFEKKKLVERV
jgi:aminopeptidase-like protein/CMP-N-acetylneuraminic acid synthetase